MNILKRSDRKESGDKLTGVAKRFCLIFLPLLALVSAITAGFLYQEIEVQRKLLLSDQRRNVAFMRGTVVNDISAIILDLMSLSAHPRLHQMLKSGNPDDRLKLSRVFLDFCKTKALYDQVRFLDETGMELIRVNFNEGQPHIVPEGKLQNKGKRYYFADTIKLDSGQVFVSPLDLNVERGQIEQPLKPMIRFGTPVAYTEGRKRGIVLLNYFGSKMIQALNKASADTIGNWMLLNAEGYWLKGLDPEDEWGFMYKDRKDRTLALRNPRAWEKVKDRDEGQFEDGQGLYTFATVWPLAHGMSSSTGSGQAFKPSASALASEGYYWKIVSFIPAEVLYERTAGILIRWLPIYALLVIFLGFAAWYLALNASRRKQAEEALKKAHDELERKVQDRTAQLKIAKEAAEAASKAKSLFIANMSHELRTPLNGIIVSAELALGQELPPKVEKIQKTILRSGRAILRTVDTILDFSKSENGKLELAAIPFRLDEVLGKLSGKFVQKGAQKQIKISFDIDADELPNALIGDPDRLVDVFNHLLDNAAKFSTGIPKAVIGVRAMDTSSKKTTLEFHVKDNGIGIASKDFEKIFDAFAQGDTSSTRQYDGTGMGLTVSKRLVEGMGGTIRVKSEIGKGSTFYFTVSFDRQGQEHPFKVPTFKDLEDKTVDPMSSKTDRKMESPELLLELLSKMAPFVQNRKPKPCKEIMAEISGYAWPDEYAKEIVALDRLIGKYKFKEALPLVEALQSKLKG